MGVSDYYQLNDVITPMHDLIGDLNPLTTEMTVHDPPLYFFTSVTALSLRDCFFGML